MNVLQFIDQKNILSVIDKIKSKTKPKGLNIIASFVAQDEEQKRDIVSKGGCFFDAGELKEIYKDWKIYLYEEDLGNWETHEKFKHRHFNVKLIAEKP